MFSYFIFHVSLKRSGDMAFCLPRHKKHKRCWPLSTDSMNFKRTRA